MSIGLYVFPSVFGLVLLVLSVQTSKYDPHVYPQVGPFFEGWYSRLTDSDNERSLGVLFGRVLPRDSECSTSLPTTYIAILSSSRDDDTPMVVAEAYPDDSDIEITVGNGQPVSRNPARTTPAHFQWVSRSYGYFNVTPTSTVFNFTIDGVTFGGNFSEPIPWDSTGYGPEGWLSDLPLIPIHWFVYSLGSNGSYTWSNASSGLVLRGRAHAHQEKNLGEGFPSGWLWTQAYDRAANASFAGSFGIISPQGLFGVPAHLFGYRNFGNGLSLDFRPDNSITRRDLKPCEGRALINIHSGRYNVEITASAPVETFDRCLRGPVKYGFAPNLVETYEATIHVTISQRGLFRYSLIEQHTFRRAALEFGREFLCPQNPCDN